MAYVNLSDVQKFLWLTSSSDVSRLNTLLTQTTEIINGIIWDIRYWEKEELIEMRQVICWRDIFLRTPNVSSIIEINWKEYKGEFEKDFFALRPQKRKVRILDLMNYLDTDTMRSCVFKIKFMAWYQVIPDDIKMAQCLLVAYSYSKDAGKTILKYVMWPRTVQYDSMDWVYTDAMKILGRYKQVNLLP